MLQEFAAVRLLIFGVLLVVLIGFLPEGLLVPLASVARRVARPARA